MVWGVFGWFGGFLDGLMIEKTRKSFADAYYWIGVQR